MIIDYLDNVFPESSLTCKQDLLLTYLRNIDFSGGGAPPRPMQRKLQHVVLKGGGKDFTGAKCVNLPEPDSQVLTVPLRDAFARRQSVRSYSPNIMTLDELSSWLAAAVGDHPTEKLGVRRRHYPSGGALYPIEVYVLSLRLAGLERGLYHYHPARHQLQVIDESVDVDANKFFFDPSQMSGVTNASTWDHAAGVLILSAHMNNSYAKYGDRSWKLMLLEAGHLAQNFTMVAAAMSNISLCPMGGMSLSALSKYMKLSGYAELPIYPFSFGSVDR
ncbi:MAG: SagB/ThcOx family dehydrogenase [Rhodanobacter sp.]|nr:MAG: SagB/ThcOx family dehydrogenase [Rhodanobacter sp.]